MNAKGILKHCLERDRAWSEGYTAGYQSATTRAISAKAPGPMLLSAVGEASGRLLRMSRF